MFPVVFGPHTHRNVYSCLFGQIKKIVTFTVFSIRSSLFNHLDSIILTSLVKIGGLEPELLIFTDPIKIFDVLRSFIIIIIIIIAFIGSFQF